METTGRMWPKLNFKIVSPPICSAELKPGKNFKNPNQKNTIPSDILRNVSPWRAFQAIDLLSMVRIRLMILIVMVVYITYEQSSVQGCSDPYILKR
jgi:hypothetical protein